MAAPILHVGAMVQCPHQIPAQLIAASARVKVGGQPVLVVNDTFIIAGCPFTVGTKYQGCVKITWIVPATRVKVGGQVAADAVGADDHQGADAVDHGALKLLFGQVACNRGRMNAGGRDGQQQGHGGREQ